jgi:LysM repeat protein
MNIHRNEPQDPGDDETGGFNIRKPLDREMKSGSGSLKRNELAVILVGAGVATVLAFFIFFGPTDKEKEESMAMARSIEALTARVVLLETLVKELKASPKASPALPAGFDPAKADRVEAVLNQRSETLTKRLDGLESRFAELAKMVDRSGGSKAAAAPAAQTPEAKPAKPEKSVAKAEADKVQPAKEAPAAGTVHVVVKGDTLYSISKRYNTTVDAIRKKNKLAEGTEIHIGDKLVVAP